MSPLTYSDFGMPCTAAKAITASSSSALTGMSSRDVSFPSGFDRPDLDSMVWFSLMVIINLMYQYEWAQFALLFWVAICFFAAGARSKGIPLTRSAWWEIAQAAAIVVLLFALLSEGRGCSSTGGGTIDVDAFCVGEPRC